MKNLLIFLMFLTSCNILKKDIKHVEKIHSRNPQIIQNYCADNYIIIDSIKEVITYKPGVIQYDTVEVIIDCDTAKNKKVKVPCPPNKTTVDTFYRDKDIIKENKAKIIISTAKIDSIKTILIKEQTINTRIKKQLKFVSILLILILISMLIKLYIKYKK